MFSVLYPWMWLALPAVGVPLWLHLQRRNDPRTVRFSAIQFLDDQPIARRRPLLPRDIPLLILRVLLILLMIAAFSWPYWSSEEGALVQESHVYILDNTLSNQAEEQFAASRDQVAAAIEPAGVETQIAVIELADEPRVVVQFGDDRRLAAQRIRELPAGFHRGSYAGAFRLAEKLLDQALGERKKVILLSDSQTNQWEDDAAVSAFLKGTEVELPRPSKHVVANLAVRQPIVRRAELGDEPTVQCALSVSRSGKASAPVLRVLANGKRVYEDTLQLNAAESEQTLLVELPDQADAWLHGEVAVNAENDALAADNRAYFSLPPRRAGRVALLARSLYLRTAFSNEVLSDEWVSQLLSSTNISDHQPADVLFLESEFLEQHSVREMVRNYLSGGRGVALLVGRGTPATLGFLRDFGIEVLPNDQRGSAPFRYVFLNHPIFQPFRALDSGNLAEVLIRRHRRLQFTDASALAFSSSGDPVILESTVARGQLLVFAFHLDREETSWPLDPTFLPFLDGCVKYLRGSDESPATQYLPGETCVWKVPAVPGDQALRVVDVVRFGEASDPIRVPVQNGEVRFEMPAIPGNYDLFLGDRQLAVLSVNPAADESDLRFSDGRETLDGWRRQTSTDDAGSLNTRSLPELSRQEIFRQRLWWWVLTAAFVAFALETVWAMRGRTFRERWRGNPLRIERTGAASVRT